MNDPKTSLIDIIVMEPYRLIRFIGLLLIAIVFCFPASAYAGSSLATNGNSAIAHVIFKVIIPPSLTLQVGTVSQSELLATRSQNDSSGFSGGKSNPKPTYIKVSGNLTKKGTLNFSNTILLADKKGQSYRLPHYILCSP